MYLNAKSLTVLIELLGVVLDPAVVSFVHDSIVICVRVTLVPRPIFVCVVLVCVRTIRTIVQSIWFRPIELSSDPGNTGPLSFHALQ